MRKHSYTCDEFSMVILLPKRTFWNYTIGGKIKRWILLNDQSLNGSHEVILSIPKFKIESEVRPISSIEAMGYTEMFSDRADFSGISDTTLKIGNIIHKRLLRLAKNIRKLLPLRKLKW